MRADRCRAATKEDVALKNKSVTDDAYVVPITQGFPQGFEKARADFRKLLDLSGKGRVQPLTEVLNLCLLLEVLRLSSFKRLL